MADRQRFQPQSSKPDPESTDRKSIDTRAKSSNLYRSPRWRRARAGFLRHNPLCVLCQRDGRTKPATVVDHVRPWRRINIEPDALTIIVCGPNGSGKTSFCNKHRDDGDLVFDADDVARSIGFIKSKRAGDVMQLVTDWRNALVDRIMAGTMRRRCFIIVARRSEANAIQVRTGGQLVDLGDDDASHDMEAFWNPDNWQALCASCHGRKTVVQDGGFGRAETKDARSAAW